MNKPRAIWLFAPLRMKFNLLLLVGFSSSVLSIVALMIHEAFSTILQEELILLITGFLIFIILLFYILFTWIILKKDIKS